MFDDIQNFHDKIIKETFSKPALAKEYFRQFLPEKLKELIDIESMTIENGSYLSDDMREYFADLLFKFKLKHTGEKLVISLLFEHKANPDKHVLIQIGHYIFSQWVKELRNKQKIIPIVPMIYYQGKKEWEVPKITNLFNAYPEEILKYLPTFDYIFFAINTLTKQQLDEVTDVMLMIALAGHNPNMDLVSLIKKLKDIKSLKRIDESDRNFIKHIFVYKLWTSKTNTML